PAPAVPDIADASHVVAVTSGSTNLLQGRFSVPLPPTHTFLAFRIFFELQTLCSNCHN
ncbi:hypothetical protein A2U01_0055261, partial [Trifolium medium]|nr:hypothetical protein [Trifolium medium]